MANDGSGVVVSSPDGGYTDADTLYVENHCVEQDVACTLELEDYCGFDGGGGNQHQQEGGGGWL